MSAELIAELRAEAAKLTEASRAGRGTFDRSEAKRRAALCARAADAIAEAWDAGAEYAVDYSMAPLYDNPYRITPADEEAN